MTRHVLAIERMTIVSWDANAMAGTGFVSLGVEWTESADGHLC